MLISEYDHTNPITAKDVYCMCEDLHLQLVLSKDPRHEAVYQIFECEGDDRFKRVYTICYDGMHYEIKRSLNDYEARDITNERPLFTHGFVSGVNDDNVTEADPNEIADAIINICKSYDLNCLSIGV